MQTLTIYRTIATEKNILGLVTLSDSRNKVIFNCVSLELPSRDNQKRISCIPPGVYRAYKCQSKSKGLVYLLFDVPNRSEIMIHVGNYSADTQGCILLGRNVGYSDRFEEHYISESKLTMKSLIDKAETTMFINIK